MNLRQLREHMKVLIGDGSNQYTSKGSGDAANKAASDAHEKAAMFHDDAAKMHRKGEADAPSMSHAAAALTAKAVVMSPKLSGNTLSHAERAVAHSKTALDQVTGKEFYGGANGIASAHEKAASAHRDAALFFRRKN